MTRLSGSNKGVCEVERLYRGIDSIRGCSRANITINTINNNIRDVVYIAEALYHYYSNAAFSVGSMMRDKRLHSRFS